MYQYSRKVNYKIHTNIFFFFLFFFLSIVVWSSRTLWLTVMNIQLQTLPPFSNQFHLPQQAPLLYLQYHMYSR